jgi:hypothetical protein
MAIDMESVILEVVGRLAPGKSASSEEVARAADPEGWRRLTGHVRNTARGLARQGRLVITRHGKPADPERLKGVYRLRLPTEDERLAAVAAAAASAALEVAPPQGEDQ